MRPTTFAVLALSTSYALAAPVANVDTQILHKRGEGGSVASKALEAGKKEFSSLGNRIKDAFLGTAKHIKAINAEGSLAGEKSLKVVQEAAGRNEAAKAALERLAFRKGLAKSPEWALAQVKVLKGNADNEALAMVREMAMESKDPKQKAAARAVLDGITFSFDSNRGEGKAWEEARNYAFPNPSEGGRGKVPWDPKARLAAVTPADDAANNPLYKKLAQIDENANRKAIGYGYLGDSVIGSDDKAIPAFKPRPQDPNAPATIDFDPKKNLAKEYLSDDPSVVDHRPIKSQPGWNVAKQGVKNHWILDADGHWQKYVVQDTTSAQAKAKAKDIKSLMILGGVTVSGLAGAWILMTILGTRPGLNGTTVVGSGQPAEEGALSEADEKTILNWIVDHPDQYPTLMKQLQTIPGLSQKELDLFVAAKPTAQEASDAETLSEDQQQTVAGTSPTAPGGTTSRRVRRRLEELD